MESSAERLGRYSTILNCQYKYSFPSCCIFLVLGRVARALSDFELAGCPILAGYARVGHPAELSAFSLALISRAA
jgi:hypothetical protein